MICILLQSNIFLWFKLSSELGIHYCIRFSSDGKGFAQGRGFSDIKGSGIVSKVHEFSTVHMVKAMRNEARHENVKYQVCGM